MLFTLKQMPQHEGTSLSIHVKGFNSSAAPEDVSPRLQSEAYNAEVGKAQSKALLSRELNEDVEPAGPVSFAAQVTQARCEESALTQLQYNSHKGGTGHLLHPFCIRQGFLHREENSCELLSYSS